jgi:hypothetical protein
VPALQGALLNYKPVFLVKKNNKIILDNNMIPKSQYEVFIAIPFDGGTKPMYSKIIKKLEVEFDEKFVFTFGTNDFIGRTPFYRKIEAFKNQNSDLLNQFSSNINSADIIIADLSYNNANVHVELGIALTLNKNILRTSGRNLIEVASDLKGTEVTYYNDEEKLLKIIKNYLNQFLRIKELPLAKRTRGPFYRAYFNKLTNIIHDNGAPNIGRAIAPISFKMRDGALRVKFKFESAITPKDWFGIYFRFGSANPWASGYLLHIRKNGQLVLAELPDVDYLKKTTYPSLSYNQEYTLSLG